MPRRSRLTYLLAALTLVASIGVALGQQQLGNPVCEIPPNDPSCAFLYCSGSFPGDCTPDPVLQRTSICRLSGPPSGCTALTSPTPRTKTPVLKFDVRELGLHVPERHRRRWESYRKD